ncbi:lipopolysaccharide assembly protein [Thermoflavifilum aggregans]|uniref:Lipopolysaccharide assembly protein n=1 Tax=Thermoflavifilum aggregans TaxID=454188 RepID=A0A2M9CUM0_9BACT|nr:LptE family protein [Thermoflavifilum aggregans]PJJ75508.1 lipopolysaccharide assembly protein [Thermoflavifilum aggregans]
MNKASLYAIGLCIAAVLCGCGIYSFTGASVDPNAHTINVHFFENRAPIVNPTLAQKFTEALRNKILNQTHLTQVNSNSVDYDISGAITGYTISTSGVTNVEQSATDRLTITVNVVFKDNLNPKKSFTQSFSRFADFNANQSIDQVADQLIQKINDQLTDDIFNKAFSNW